MPEPCLTSTSLNTLRQLVIREVDELRARAPDPADNSLRLYLRADRALNAAPPHRLGGPVDRWPHDALGLYVSHDGGMSWQ